MTRWDRLVAEALRIAGARSSVRAAMSRCEAELPSAELRGKVRKALSDVEVELTEALREKRREQHAAACDARAGVE